MIGSIQLEYIQLVVAINQLKQLKSGTGMCRYVTSDLINHSRGKMFNSVNNFHEQLCLVEKEMIELIDKTMKAMVSAGISFEQAEIDLMDIYSKISPF